MSVDRKIYIFLKNIIKVLSTLVYSSLLTCCFWQVVSLIKFHRNLYLCATESLLSFHYLLLIKEMAEMLELMDLSYVS